MTVKLESTHARVRDPEKAREVRDDYELRGVEIDLREEGDGWVLEMKFEDPEFDWWEWPLALHRDHWPAEEQGAGEYEGEEDDLEPDEWDKLFEEKGKEGFLQLLRDLSPLLLTPLLILAANRDGQDCWSRTWRIAPGAVDIETLEVSI